VLLLVGCVGTGDPAVIGQRAASGGGVYEGPPVELAFWNGFTGGDGPAMRELVDRFNDEHENISVAMNVMIWDPDFYQKTPAAVGSGNGPDVGIMHVERLATNAARGVIVPLDEVADSQPRRGYSHGYYVYRRTELAEFSHGGRRRDELRARPLPRGHRRPELRVLPPEGGLR
jgi:ABC-type glycerol-3-phosphate transport system substrate-binding protein